MEAKMAKKAKKTKETIEIKETGKCCFCDKVYENSGHNTVGYWKEEEEKKGDELPVDPEAAKLEVHTMLNDLVADEIEAINGYDDAKTKFRNKAISNTSNRSKWGRENNINWKNSS